MVKTGGLAAYSTARPPGLRPPSFSFGGKEGYGGVGWEGISIVAALSRGL